MKVFMNISECLVLWSIWRDVKEMRALFVHYTLWLITTCCNTGYREKCFLYTGTRRLNIPNMFQIRTNVPCYRVDSKLHLASFHPALILNSRAASLPFFFYH